MRRLAKYSIYFFGGITAILINVVYWDTSPFTSKTSYYTAPESGAVLGAQTIDEGEKKYIAQDAYALMNPFPSVVARGGVIPHDVLHEEYIGHFFSGLVAQHPQTVILIGPNHFERGKSDVILSDAVWETRYGQIQPDQDVVEKILEIPDVIIDVDAVRGDHSMTIPLSLLRQYLPDTKVVPIIFKANISRSEIQTLGDTLSQLLSEEVVLIAAVDFSHYLTAKEAEQKDRYSQKALVDFDYDAFLHLGSNFNDYVDSPSSIALLLYCMAKIGAVNVNILHHTNSGFLSGNLNIPVTSYFEVVYH